MKLIRVEAPHFTAGVVYGPPERGHPPCIVRAAPILAWSIGKPVSSLVVWCRRKGYRYVVL